MVVVVMMMMNGMRDECKGKMKIERMRWRERDLKRQCRYGEDKECGRERESDGGMYA